MMIFKLDKSYDVAVLEMGMSDFGEIHNLCEVQNLILLLLLTLECLTLKILKQEKIF